MDLDSPLQHGWDKNLVIVWSFIASPEDKADMFFVVNKRNDYENDGKSSGDESPKEYLFDQSDSEESDNEYY